MRTLLLVFFLFTLPFIANSRELSFTENLAIISLKSNHIVLEYMSENIETSEITKKDLIYFHILKRSCYPINKELENIAQADEEEMMNRIQYITVYMSACREGVLNLTKLYIKYKQ